MNNRVLIVDDAMFMRKILGDILKKENYQVVGEASDGGEAFEKYEELKPDLVTMDITMSPISGLDGTKKIMEKYPEALIIMVSAMGQKHMIMESVKAGAKDFIVKPFRKEEVLKKIKKLGIV